MSCHHRPPSAQRGSTNKQQGRIWYEGSAGARPWADPRWTRMGVLLSTATNRISLLMPIQGPTQNKDSCLSVTENRENPTVDIAHLRIDPEWEARLGKGLHPPSSTRNEPRPPGRTRRESLSRRSCQKNSCPPMGRPRAQQSRTG